MQNDDSARVTERLPFIVPIRCPSERLAVYESSIDAAVLLTLPLTITCCMASFPDGGSSRTSEVESLARAR